MKHIAFIRDPDNYWIELLQPTPFYEPSREEAKKKDEDNNEAP